MNAAHVKVWRGRRWIDGSPVWVSQCQAVACDGWLDRELRTTHAAALAAARTHCRTYPRKDGT